MTAPITPDERAEWRALADAATEGPWGGDDEHGDVPCAAPAWCVSKVADDGRWVHDIADVWGPDAPANTEFIAHARTAVPRLLDALDTAEEFGIGDWRVTTWAYEQACAALDEHRKRAERAEAEVARLLAERTAAHADDATCASCTHEYVADVEKRAEDAEAEVMRLYALGTLAGATVSPAWDEDAGYDEAQTAAARVVAPYTSGPMDPLDVQVTDAILAVVRRHLPVSGESRAQVESTALREWIAEWPTTPDDGTFLADVARDGLARADRIEKGETR